MYQNIKWLCTSFIMNDIVIFEYFMAVYYWLPSSQIDPSRSQKQHIKMQISLVRKKMLSPNFPKFFLEISVGDKLSLSQDVIL